jgi:gas vesicle protein
MAPSVANDELTQKADGGSGTGIQLEHLLLREDDIYQTNSNSEDFLESLAPIIKDSIKQNGLGDLITRLNDIVKNKDQELNDLSLNSTDEINSCIDSIDSIHIDSVELANNLSSVSKTLSDSVNQLVNRKKSLIKSKQVNTKINETSVVLTLCVQVLEITNKIHELIKQHKYFSALKLIDELTNIHLPKVEKFSFALKIYDSIPHLTKMIKDESFDNIINWLSLNLERKLPEIGDCIYTNLQHLQENWESLKSRNPSFLPYKLNAPIELSLRDPLLNFDAFRDPSLQMDLNTVYDGILVYQTLDEQDLLISLYHKEWMKKYNKIIYPITTTTADRIAQFSNIGALDEYLQRISSFFVMDKQINIATKFQLRTNLNSNDLWNAYVTKLKPVLLNYLTTRGMSDLEELTAFKDLIGDFLQVMEMSDYKIFELYEILMIIFKDHFVPQIIQSFRLEFLDSIHTDHYMPLTVDAQSDYENIMQICWFKSDAPFAPQNVKHMPITFPFSEDYVHFCLGIRSLLEDVLQFIGQHFSYELNEIKTTIVNDVIEKVLGNQPGIGISHDIREFISNNSTKEVVAQSYTNLEYYLYSLYELGRLVNRRLRQQTGIGMQNIDANDAFTLRAVKHFSDLRKFSEEEIFHMVDNKLNELLEFLDYDDNWLPTERNEEAHYFIKDFALFLDNLFTKIFSNLPLAIRTLGLFRTFDRVSEHFLYILKSAGKYNRIGIENFDMDVQYIEESMKALYSMNQTNDEGGNNALESTFTELRQSIDLLLLDNFEDFNNNVGFRMRYFDRVRYEDGVKLISNLTLGNSENTSTIEDPNESQTSLEQSASAKFSKFSSRFNI